jgi:hypothetical protein
MTWALLAIAFPLAICSCINCKRCGASSGLLVSAVAMRGSMDVCGWVIAWVVSKT